PAPARRARAHRRRGPCPARRFREWSCSSCRGRRGTTCGSRSDGTTILAAVPPRSCAHTGSAPPPSHSPWDQDGRYTRRRSGIPGLTGGHSWGRGSGRTSFFLTEFRANAHEGLSEHVLAAAVAAVSPISVVGRVLHDLRVAGREQDLPEFRVLCKLGQHCFAHHRILDSLPVGSQRLLATAPHARRDHRRLHVSDRLAVRLIEELVSLEVMLTRGPDRALQGDRVGREIGEAPVFVLDAVESDLLLHHLTTSRLPPLQQLPQAHIHPH